MKTAIGHIDNSPSIWVGNVEVFLNREDRVIGFIVHLKISPICIHTEEVQKYIGQKVHCVIQYLEKEGFIPLNAKQEWMMEITGICE